MAAQNEVVARQGREDEVHGVDEERPLLARPPAVRDDPGDGLSPMQRAISQTYQSTAHLATLLPTGTVMAFQLRSPIVTDQGHCVRANRAMAGALVALCGLSCFALSFTDSFRDAKGAVRYGFATRVALFDHNVVSCFYPVPSEDAAQVLTVLPIAIGVVGSMLFVTFPTTRHGIGFPLSQH
uniref:Uncharacterized protein n=1 Tax=Aegilops tauschii TaxID=37682 RepID=M8BTY9_AEGTA